MYGAIFMWKRGNIPDCFVSAALTREGSNNTTFCLVKPPSKRFQAFFSPVAFVLPFRFCIPRVLNLLSINLRLVGHSSGPSTRVRSTISVNKSGKRLVYIEVGTIFTEAGGRVPDVNMKFSS